MQKKEMVDIIGLKSIINREVANFSYKIFDSSLFETTNNIVDNNDEIQREDNLKIVFLDMHIVGSGMTHCQMIKLFKVFKHLQNIISIRILCMTCIFGIKFWTKKKNWFY